LPLCGTLFLYNMEICKAPKSRHLVSAKEEEDKEEEKEEETRGKNKQRERERERERESSSFVGNSPLQNGDDQNTLSVIFL